MNQCDIVRRHELAENVRVFAQFATDLVMSMAELVTAPTALIGAVTMELTHELKNSAETRIKAVDIIVFILISVEWW